VAGASTVIGNHHSGKSERLGTEHSHLLGKLASSKTIRVEMVVNPSRSRGGMRISANVVSMS
jgi:hypothetical protein